VLDVTKYNQLLARLQIRPDKDGKLAGSWPSKVSPISSQTTGPIDMMLTG